MNRHVRSNKIARANEAKRANEAQYFDAVERQGASTEDKQMSAFRRNLIADHLDLLIQFLKMGERPIGKI